MEGLEKILSRIKDDSNAKITEIIAKANAEANDISAAMKAKVEAECSDMQKKMQNEKKNILDRTEASKELKHKQVKLVARREAIDEVLKYAKEKINTLSIKEYEDLLVKTFEKYALSDKAKGKNVKLCFGEKDLKNVSKEIIDGLLNKAKVNDINMTLSDKPVNINSGFILDFGDILENCSFDALIDQNKEALEDKINKILF